MQHRKAKIDFFDKIVEDGKCKSISDAFNFFALIKVSTVSWIISTLMSFSVKMVKQLSEKFQN